MSGKNLLKKGDRIPAGRNLLKREKVFSGNVLPFSKYDDGSVEFDSDAGIVGGLKRTFMLPGQVMNGEVDLNTPEGARRVFEAAGTMTPASRAMSAVPGKSAGVFKAGQPKRPKVPVPTQRELFDAAKPIYKESDKAGVEYSLDAVRNLAAQIKQELHMQGIGDEIAPKTFKILSDLENPPQGAVSAPLSTGVNIAKRKIQRIASDVGEERTASGIGSNRIMDFIENPPEAAIVSGPARTMGKKLKEANANYSAGKRSENVQSIIQRSEDDASAANSGLNAENRMRQRTNALLNNKNSRKERQSLSDDERSALRKAMKGTHLSNNLRLGANLLGGGQGMGGGLAVSIGALGGNAIGGVPGGLIGGAAPIIGAHLMKAGSRKIVRDQIKKADELTRMRSPLYQERVRNTPAITPVADVRAPLAKAALIERMNAGDYDDPEQASNGFRREPLEIDLTSDDIPNRSKRR